MCGTAWQVGQRTCPKCGSGSRRRAVAKPTVSRYFTSGMIESERAAYPYLGIHYAVELVRWLVRLPLRIRAYRRNAGLWPRRD
jgi:hypothetical protein